MFEINLCDYLVYEKISAYSSYSQYKWLEVHYDKQDEIKEWCKECVGPNQWNYYGLEKKTRCVLRFKRQEDLLAFKLRFNL